MSGRVEAIIRKAVESLQRRDGALAEEVFRDDRVIDRMEMDIEERDRHALPRGRARRSRGEPAVRGDRAREQGPQGRRRIRGTADPRVRDLVPPRRG